MTIVKYRVDKIKWFSRKLNSHAFKTHEISCYFLSAYDVQIVQQIDVTRLSTENQLCLYLYVNTPGKKLPIFKLNIIFFCILVDNSMWQEVVDIYSALLDCVTCNSTDVRQALKEALKEFAALLAAPQRQVNADSMTSKTFDSCNGN